jgi:hypothetical protein
MAIVTINLGNEPTSNGSNCALNATYDNTTNTFQSLIVVKDGDPNFQPSLEVIRNSDGAVVRNAVVDVGSPITYDISAVASKISLDSEGNLVTPWTVVFVG